MSLLHPETNPTDHLSQIQFLISIREWSWFTSLCFCPTAEGHTNERTAGYQSSPLISHWTCGPPTRQERHLGFVSLIRDGAEPEVSFSWDCRLMCVCVCVWVGVLNLSINYILSASCQDAGWTAAAAGKAFSSRQRPIKCCYCSHICRQSPQGECLFPVCSLELFLLQPFSFCRHIWMYFLSAANALFIFVGASE